jgi:hypothetical protein
MDKKQYITPEMEEYKLNVTSMLCASDDTETPGTGESEEL